MKRMSMFIWATAAIILSFAVSPTPSRSQPVGEPLLMENIPNAIYWDIYVAIDKGFFQAEGFAPQLVQSQSTAQAIQMLVSRGVHISTAQPEPMIAAIERGASDIGILCAPADFPDWVLMASSDINTIADLKGKTLGFSGLRVGEYWLTLQALAQNGLKSEDVSAIVVGPTPAKLAALEKKSISGAVLFQPGAAIAQRNGAKPLFRFASLPSFPALVYVASRTWAAENNHGKRFTAAITKAHSFLYDLKNRDEAVTILAKYTKRDAALLGGVYDLYFVTDKLYSRDAAVSVAGLERVTALMAANGEFQAKAPPPPSAYILPSSVGALSR